MKNVRIPYRLARRIARKEGLPWANLNKHEAHLLKSGAKLFKRNNGLREEWWLGGYHWNGSDVSCYTT